ncbi:hypothetical protein [Compostibacillus humi]|uniref:hypothetical protein n=1 Tax=Compostibacillus humi TaxID=1245525 RepID=UPI001663B5AC|nr:hypothetical protein [Compostibacillus humi]
MRILLELLRILILFLFLGLVGWNLINNVYLNNQVDSSFTWLGGAAIFLILFVLYRNKLQFSGWYRGRKKKLPKLTTYVIIALSLLLILLPFIIGV